MNTPNAADRVSCFGHRVNPLEKHLRKKVSWTRQTAESEFPNIGVPSLNYPSLIQEEEGRNKEVQEEFPADVNRNASTGNVGAWRPDVGSTE
jgi:hypothetical protein